MSISLDVPINLNPYVEVRIYDVRVDDRDLEFEARVDRDGDIRIEISEYDFIRVAKERFGLVEPTDE